MTDDIRYETVVVDTPFDGGPLAGTSQGLYESLLMMAAQMRQMNHWEIDHPIEARLDSDVFVLLSEGQLRDLETAHHVHAEVRTGVHD